MHNSENGRCSSKEDIIKQALRIIKKTLENLEEKTPCNVFVYGLCYAFLVQLSYAHTFILN
jgi:hypothetical protein